MIFIDSNIPMYLIGIDHPNKKEAFRHLENLLQQKQKLVSNTEVLQELLHRYQSLNRPDAIEEAFNMVYQIVDKMYEIKERDVLKAKEIVTTYRNLSSRDAIHAAFMRRLRIQEIFTFDQGFDQIPELERIPS